MVGNPGGRVHPELRCGSAGAILRSVDALSSPPGAARTVVARQEVAGLTFSSLRYEPRVTLDWHVHPAAYVSFVETGSYTERLGRLTRQCDASTLLLHAAGERHANVFHERAVRLLRVEAIDSPLLDLAPGVTASQGDRGRAPGMLCRRMLHELHAPDDVTPLALHGFALELVAVLTRASAAHHRRGPRWLERVDDLLQERFPESLALIAIAASVGVHPVHLARTYRQHRGRTIGERIRELRIEYACHLLATTCQTIAEVAQGCGFADQSHLARLMRRRLGLSPTQYRAGRTGR